MMNDLFIAVIVDHETGRITPVSNLRGVGDMIQMIGVLDQIASGMRQAVYDALQDNKTPPPPENQ